MEIIIKPVFSRLILLIAFSKNKGSILSKKYILFISLFRRISINALDPKLDPPVPKIIKLFLLDIKSLVFFIIELIWSLFLIILRAGKSKTILSILSKIS